VLERVAKEFYEHGRPTLPRALLVGQMYVR